MVMIFFELALVLLLPAGLCAGAAPEEAPGVHYGTAELNGLFPDPASLLNDYRAFFSGAVFSGREKALFEIESSSALPAADMRAVLVRGTAGSSMAQRLLVTAEAGKRTHVLYDSGFFQRECGAPGYRAGAAFTGGKGRERYAAFEVVRTADSCCGADGEETVTVYFADPADHSLITEAEKSHRTYPDTECSSKPSLSLVRESELKLEGDFLYIRTRRISGGIKAVPENAKLRIKRRTE